MKTLLLGAFSLILCASFVPQAAQAEDLQSLAARVQVLEDREAIFEMLDEAIGHNPQPEGSGTYHLLTNDQIEVDGDTASAVTKWVYVTPGDDGSPRLVFLGHYNDRFVRENGEWKFLRREAPVDIPVQE